MILSLLLSIACNTPSESGKDAIIIAPKHVVPKQDDFKNKSFFCCSDQGVHNLLMAYLEFSKSLAADKGAQALPQAKEFLTLAAKHPKLAQESKDLTHLWDSAEGIQSNLNEISLKMIDVVKESKSDKGTKIIVAFCPMAPGRWLQTEATISNPYYGSKMLTCGVFE